MRWVQRNGGVVANAKRASDPDQSNACRNFASTASLGNLSGSIAAMEERGYEQKRPRRKAMRRCWKVRNKKTNLQSEGLKTVAKSSIC
jgi:hypothetical protein